MAVFLLPFQLPNSMRLSLLISACGSLILGTAISCRTSAPELPKQRGLGTVFDTAYRPQPGGGPALLKPLDEAYARYHQTLAEPVSVIQWSSDFSRWEVFFATNRRNQATESAAGEYIAGNQVSPSVTYGRAEAQIPGRRRGEDPKLSGSKSPLTFLSGFSGQKEDGNEPLAEVLQVRSLPPQEFLAGLNRQITESTGKDLLVFVHGFNVNFDAAVLRTAQLGLDLPFNGGICCYSWPSQGGIKNYKADEIVNADSVAPFQEFLQTLIRGVAPETRIQIVVHSMGNRLVMQALNNLSESGDGVQPIDNVVLCAPDVGLSDYHSWIEGVKKMSRRVTLYMGDSDTALLASKALHSEQRAGDAIPPTIVAGVETVDCSPVEMSLMGHSYYGGNVEVLCDLFSVLKEDLPPEQRSWLSPQQHNGQTFWRFTSQPVPVLFTWNFPPEKLIPAAATIQQASDERTIVK